MNAKQQPETKTQPDSEHHPKFAIQRLYLKDASFEVPSPEFFRKESHPKVNIELNTHTANLGEDVFEVIIGVTATAKSEEKVVFLVEVKQAGIFTIKEFPNEQVEPMLHIVCTNILFPYVREALSNLVVRGGFPQFNLEPINFEGLYLQRKQQEKAKHDEDKKKG